MKLAAAVALGLALGAGSAVAQSPEPPAACEAGAGVNFICNVRNPEDLVQVPGTDWIIGSGLATANQPGSGGLILIDRRGKTAVRLPAPAGAARAPFHACQSPPDPAAFSAHGLSIAPAGPGRATLLVVGHGGREAVEVFDVVANGAGAPTVTWAGCLPGPQGAYMNSVAGPLPSGRIYVTEFYRPPQTMQNALRGENTGGVYWWSPATGEWVKLPGTDVPGANGVAVTPDEKYLFIAVTGTSSIMRFELGVNDPPTVLRTDFRSDNLRWAPNGRLLAAGPGPVEEGCVQGAERRCAQGPVVGALDPATMALTVMKRGPAEPNFPGTSSALIVGDELWLGSYNAQRVAWQVLGR